METSTTNQSILETLFSLQDLNYKKFHAKLIPNIQESKIIGIRTPILRTYAKQIYVRNQYEDFLHRLPHNYYEENNLHAFLIEQINDYNICIKYINIFLPYIDNWATCDMFSPKVLKKHKKQLLTHIKIWMKSNHTYEVRFAINMLMKHFLDKDFKSEYLDLVKQIKHDDYYVKMGMAWFFQTALTKQEHATLPYLINHELDVLVHNKTIQKAIESKQIRIQLKQYLKQLKR